MRGTPFTKFYPADQRNTWDRYDRLPLEYRQMVADDPNGYSLVTLEAAEDLAREAGLLPPLPGEKELNKKELRTQRDRERSEEAKARSRVVYKVLLPPGTVIMRNPPPEAKPVVVKVVKVKPQSKSKHNS